MPKKQNKVLVYHSAQEDLASGRDVSAFGRYPRRRLSALKQGSRLLSLGVNWGRSRSSESLWQHLWQKAALGAMSYPVSRNKARRLMKEAGVLVKRRKKFKVTTDSNHAKPLFDNVLDRDFASDVPDQAYVQDITYI